MKEKQKEIGSGSKEEKVEDTDLKAKVEETLSR